MGDGVEQPNQLRIPAFWEFPLVISGTWALMEVLAYEVPVGAASLGGRCNPSAGT
jgi:hypothetical protein